VKDTHHKFWPRKWYVSRVERKFRNLPQNKVEIEIGFHAEIHRGLPPAKPTYKVMLREVRAHESKTRRKHRRKGKSRH